MRNVVSNPIEGRLAASQPDRSDPSPGPDVREAARACADDLINIVEAAQRAANRTGNTFVLDRERVAGMIAGKFSALTRPLGGFVQGSIADGGKCNEQSGKQPSPASGSEQ